MPEVPIVGWDVAFTTKGIFLLEVITTIVTVIIILTQLLLLLSTIGEPLV